jgi:hypothetical protein
MMKSLDKKLALIKSRTTNMFSPSIRENIFYLHIPKCGGTSINNALQNYYLKWSLSDTSNVFNLDSPASWEAVEKSQDLLLKPDTVDDYQVMRFREELLLYCMSQRHIQFISGHFSFSSRAYQAFSNRYAFITVLRNPVDRWISSYFYNRNRQGHRYRKLDMSIEEYLESDYGRSQGYEYAKFLSGVDEGGKFMTPEAVRKAKENLHKFRLVGFLEDMDSFRIQFREMFGRELNIKFLNQKPKSENPESYDFLRQVKDQVEKICQPDIEIYEYAITEFQTKK